LANVNPPTAFGQTNQLHEALYIGQQTRWPSEGLLLHEAYLDLRALHGLALLVFDLDT